MGVGIKRGMLDTKINRLFPFNSNTNFISYLFILLIYPSIQLKVGSFLIFPFLLQVESQMAPKKTVQSTVEPKHQDQKTVTKN